MDIINTVIDVFLIDGDFEVIFNAFKKIDEYENLIKFLQFITPGKNCLLYFPFEYYIIWLKLSAKLISLYQKAISSVK